ncbi:MAG: hypothetical protein WC975_03195 [Phycisphaerae bacterium]
MNSLDYGGIDKNLIQDFFCGFARFEYALKRAGYLKENEKRVMLDWDSFAKDISGKLDKDPDPKLKKAIEYLTVHPPKKQVVKEKKLGWQDISKIDSKGIEAWILRVIRTIRNNLFHGGKFTGKPVEEVARNDKLLNASVIVLRKIVRLNQFVFKFYDEPLS